MNDPLAFFLTWTTYGTWLPGDDRGSYLHGEGRIAPDRERERNARNLMRDEAVTLTTPARTLCDATIRRVADDRGWTLLGLAVRSNHVHAVVSADRSPEKVTLDFKAWCTRDLKREIDPQRSRWWTERGSYKQLFDEERVDAAVRYVVEAQDRGGREVFGEDRELRK